MAERLQRTSEQQEYRDDLAHKLKDLRGQGDTGKKLAQTLLDKEEMTDEYLESLGEGRKLSKEKSNDIAKKMIEDECIRTLVRNIKKFEGLDKDIAKKLVENGYGGTVVSYIKQFEGLDKEILFKLIDCYYNSHPDPYRGLFDKLKYFSGLDKEAMLTLLNWKAYIGYPLLEMYRRGTLGRYMENFEGLDKEIAEKFIERGGMVSM